MSVYKNIHEYKILKKKNTFSKHIQNCLIYKKKKKKKKKKITKDTCIL